ncbi:MAG: DUF533 domain-containing protein [Planctomycetes bacterium]|nr:DUF533 domain-containing protein [Planctomycetota bacterium]
MSLSFLGPLIGAAMGARPKHHRRAESFLGHGASPFLGTRGMIGLAGLAAAAYYALRSNGGSAFGSAPPVVADGTTVIRGGPPPLPEPAANPGVQRILRLVISAARCDGELGAAERAAILKEAQEIGAEHLVESELQSPRPLAQIVAGVIEPAEKEALYVLAYTVVRADQDVNGAERVFLVGLANLLALDAARAQALETETAARIASAG